MTRWWVGWLPVAGWWVEFSGGVVPCSGKKHVCWLEDTSRLYIDVSRVDRLLRRLSHAVSPLPT